MARPTRRAPPVTRAVFTPATMFDRLPCTSVRFDRLDGENALPATGRA